MYWFCFGVVFDIGRGVGCGQGAGPWIALEIAFAARGGGLILDGVGAIPVYRLSGAFGGPEPKLLENLHELQGCLLELL